MSELRREVTQYGFIYGAAKFERWHSHPRGSVVVGLKTQKYPDGIQLYVTKSGKVRIFHQGKE